MFGYSGPAITLNDLKLPQTEVEMSRRGAHDNALSFKPVQYVQMVDTDHDFKSPKYELTIFDGDLILAPTY